MPLTSGETILSGKYHILRLIGEGGMARVWLAEEVQFGNRQVAIKEPAPDLLPGSEEELTKRFRREVIVCAALEQARVPNIVRALTAEPYDSDLLLVLEYMPGGDLAHLIQTQAKGLSLAQSLEITHSILEALQGVHAHALDIVHRDVKPSNILFDARGVAHLGDFGLAQMAQQSERSTLQGGTHPGTAAYMAPEQASNVAYLTGAADLYALGCVLFEMLTGKRYKRCRAGTLASSLNAAVPGWLDEVMVKALAEDPFDRYQSAEEMAEGLKEGEVAADQASNRLQEAQRASQERQEYEARTAREADHAQLENKRFEAEVQRLLTALTAVVERKRQQKTEAPLPVMIPVNPTPENAPFIADKSPLVLTLAPGVLLPLVRIPAGEFTMGSSNDDSSASSNEKPQHMVYLDEYYIGKYEVTVAQFKTFVQATGYVVDRFTLPSGKDDYPVTKISWNDAVAFCKWASEVTGQIVRLPTEAEWEKAARGTDGRTYPWGSERPNNNLGNFNGSGNSTSVGKYSPAGDSPYGCADMAGNVREWVNDWFQTDYYSHSPGRTPVGPDSGKTKVCRGGGLHTFKSELRIATRKGNHGPDDRLFFIGFRCAVSLKGISGILETHENTLKAQQTPSATVSPIDSSSSESSASQGNQIDLTLVPGIILPLVRVPSGEFTMGRGLRDTRVDKDQKPQHTVHLDEFLIGKYEVTVGQFRAFVKATGYRADNRALPLGKDDYPVTFVNWDDAVDFCRWVSVVTGWQVHLPSEAQWEKAARGIDGRIYAWGNQAADISRCNYDKVMRGTTPVGRYSPLGDSPYGCADMPGNVCEWVNDWYQESYYSISPNDNPLGPPNGSYRVLRGGGWSSNLAHIGATYRGNYYQNARSDDIGFRCAVSPR